MDDMQRQRWGLGLKGLVDALMESMSRLGKADAIVDEDARVEAWQREFAEWTTVADQCRGIQSPPGIKTQHARLCAALDAFAASGRDMATAINSSTSWEPFYAAYDRFREKHASLWGEVMAAFQQCIDAETYDC